MGIFDDHPFEPAPNMPLYQQLYAHLQSAILAGRLPGGMKLPSTRALADELLVSRNTVLTAYDQLTAEGYIEGIEGSGTFVADVLPEQLMTTPEQQPRQPPKSRRASTSECYLSERAKAQLTSPQIYSRLLPFANGRPRPFRLGLSALDAFPYQLWARLVARRARRMGVSAITYQDPAGYPLLREAIAAHVNVSRSVRCTAEQVVIVAGAQGGLDLAARMLINEGDPVWLEDPGYVGARGALLGAGAAIVPVPIDHEGLMVDVGMERAPEARLAYITPSHQFPLGVTMSLARRLALLEWAKHANAYILEDDYDSEYRFAGRPLATVQGLDSADRVIYIGTFSKVLAPALRIGYLILPPLLVEPFLTVRRLIDFHLPILEQAVLADFIAEGHFGRHLRRMRALFAERRTALLAALGELPLDIHAFPVGSHCVGWLPAGMDGLRLAHQAAANDLNLWLVSQYSIEPLAREGLVIGYGDHAIEEMQQAVDKLAKVMRLVWPRGQKPEMVP
ncbi:MAG: PLP-dependent aminotransferase family protein [Caldilineaceae bacterium]